MNIGDTIIKCSHYLNEVTSIPFEIKYTENNNNINFFCYIKYNEVKTINLIKKKGLEFLNKNNINASFSVVIEEIDSPKKRIAKNIICSSSKGGVGKSFLLTSMAISLAKKGKKVGIIDLDISCPSIFGLLGIEFDKNSISKNHNGTIKPCIDPVYGISIVSMMMFHDITTPLALRAPLLNKSVKHLLNSFDLSDLDYVFIDTPAGMYDIHLSLFDSNKVDYAFMVSTADKNSIDGMLRLSRVLDVYKIEKLGSMFNMCSDENFLQIKKRYIFDNYSLGLIDNINLINEEISWNFDQVARNHYLISKVEEYISLIERKDEK